MPVEVGAIIEGKVTGITKFGAFVDLGEGATGLCHISEIADSYVREVADFLQEQQSVKVKVLSVDPRGKVSLSIRQAAEKPQHVSAPAPTRDFRERRSFDSNRRPPRPAARGFEDMLSNFLKDSDDKLREVKKNKGNRRGNGYNSR